MISKKNIKKIIIDAEGSSYIRFETDLELKDESLGDFYWQGDKKYFDIQLGELDRDEELKEDGESLVDFMDKECIEYMEELSRDLSDFL